SVPLGNARSRSDGRRSFTPHSHSDTAHHHSKHGKQDAGCYAVSNHDADRSHDHSHDGEDKAGLQLDLLGAQSERGAESGGSSNRCKTQAQSRADRHTQAVGEQRYGEDRTAAACETKRHSNYHAKGDAEYFIAKPGVHDKSYARSSAGIFPKASFA